MKRAWMTIIVCLLVAGWAREGHTGTYGGVERVHPGVSFYIDCGIGSLSDPRMEGPALEAAKAQAEATFNVIEPQLVAMFERYARGRHGYTRSRALLDLKRTERASDARTVTFAITVEADRMNEFAQQLGPVGAEVWVTLFLREDASDGMRQKVAADFVASQPFVARTQGLSPEVEPVDRLFGRMLMLGPQPGFGLDKLLQLAHENAYDVRVRADGGHPVALAIVGWMDGKSYAKEALAHEDQLDAALRPTLHIVLALMARDNQRAATLALLKGYPEMAEWSTILK